VIRSLHGQTVPAEPGPGDTVLSVNLTGTKVTDEQLQSLAALEGLEHLSLRVTQITDAGLKHIAKLKDLHSLDLAGTKITAEGLRSLASLETLYHLRVSGTGIGESDLSNLSGAKVLRTVLPFYGSAARAWLTPGKLRATDWAASGDGVLSLRLLVPDAEVRNTIVVLAELRNNRDKWVHVERPFRGQYATIEIRGPDGRICYSGGVPTYVIGKLPYSTLSGSRWVIRDRLWFTLDRYAGDSPPGRYEIVFTYAGAPQDDRKHATPGKAPVWMGQIRSEPITVTKARGVPPVPREQPAEISARGKALWMIGSLGGRTVPPEPRPGDTVVLVNLANTKVTDEQLQSLAALKGLQHLDLRETRITDAGLKRLAGLTDLRTVNLSGTQITAKGLRSLLSLEALYHLDVAGTRVREAELSNLVGAKALRNVFPFGRKVTEAWLTPGKLRAAEWATSQDGALSLRLLVPDAELRTSDPIVVLAELRNNTGKPMDVLRPFMDDSARIELRGPDGKVEYRRVDPTRGFGAKAFSTLSVGGVIRDRLELPVHAFAESDAPGEYEAGFAYRCHETHRKFAGTDWYGNKHPWVGQIRSKPITVTKARPSK
jgi:hypothetical protein